MGGVESVSTEMEQRTLVHKVTWSPEPDGYRDMDELGQTVQVVLSEE